MLVATSATTPLKLALNFAALCSSWPMQHVRHHPQPGNYRDKVAANKVFRQRIGKISKNLKDGDMFAKEGIAQHTSGWEQMKTGPVCGTGRTCLGDRIGIGTSLWLGLAIELGLGVGSESLSPQGLARLDSEDVIYRVLRTTTRSSKHALLSFITPDVKRQVPPARQIARGEG